MRTPLILALTLTLGMMACGEEPSETPAALAVPPAELASAEPEVGSTDPQLSVLQPQESVASMDETVAAAEVVANAAGDVEIETVLQPEVPLARFELRRGETLAHFARWSELPVEVIAETSGLDLNGVYPVGTEVLVPVDDTVRAVLEEKRELHRIARVEGYLASRGGSTGSEFYTVRSGDTAWSIARKHQELPVWLIEAYNPSVALDTLRPGQELLLPVLDSVVVENEDVE